MKRNASLVAALLLSTQIFVACRSANPASTATAAGKKSELTINACEKTIKYVSSKARDSKSQTEMDMSTEIVIDPVEKLITLSVESSQRPKGTRQASILSTDCHLNTGLTDGYSFYRASGHNPDGQNTGISFRVEAKEEGLIIIYKTDQEDAELKIAVDRWEVVN